MGEIINTNTAIETQPGGDTEALLDITQSLLADARTALNSSGVLSVPILHNEYKYFGIYRRSQLRLSAAGLSGIEASGACPLFR